VDTTKKKPKKGSTALNNTSDNTVGKYDKREYINMNTNHGFHAIDIDLNLSRKVLIVCKLGICSIREEQTRQLRYG